MDQFELLSEQPLEYYKTAYDAGFAYGLVSAGVIILFLWTVVSAFNRK
jgi:hypothetical protein